MSKARVTKVDNTFITSGVLKEISGLDFEQISQVLKVLLGPDYLVYEGNNHITVHKNGKGPHLIFIERTQL